MRRRMCLRPYHDGLNPAAPLRTCGSCGFRDLDITGLDVLLSAMPVLETPQDRVDAEAHRAAGDLSSTDDVDFDATIVVAVVAVHAVVFVGDFSQGRRRTATHSAAQRRARDAHAPAAAALKTTGTSAAQHRACGALTLWHPPRTRQPSTRRGAVRTPHRASQPPHRTSAAQSAADCTLRRPRRATRHAARLSWRSSRSVSGTRRDSCSCISVNSASTYSGEPTSDS